MSIFSSYKKIFLLGFIVAILIAIPFSVYIAQKRQQTTSQASKSTILSLDPVSSAISVGDTLTLNVMLDPGAGPTPNQVSFVKISVKFDATKFEKITDGESLAPNPDSPSSPNTLTAILEGPTYEAGKASISLSIGADPTKVVITKTKIAVLKLKAIAVATPTIPNITFYDPPETQVLSIAGSDGTSENVLSTTVPASVTIAQAAAGTTPTAAPASVNPTAALTPTPSGTSSGSASLEVAPICSGLNVDRATTGNAPYSLTFTAVGNDKDGTISKVSYNFGDGPVQTITTGGGIGTNSVNNQISHTYNNAGSYTAYAILTDNKNNLSEKIDSCAKTITVNLATAIGGGSAPQTIVSIPTQVPVATLAPTGDGKTMMNLGILGAIFTIVGGAFFILL